jgi:hypothetical protein
MYTIKQAILTQIDWYTYYGDELKQWTSIMVAKLSVYEDILMLLAAAVGGKVTK